MVYLALTTNQVKGLSRGDCYFNDIAIMMLDLEGYFERRTFEHKTGITIFKPNYKQHGIKYSIWCLDECDNNQWKEVAFGWVKNIKHLRQLRKIKTLEEAIFA